jgi:hypothetical protein
LGSREPTTAIVGRDPRHETRLWSIGVATLDHRERSIGDRGGACGVVGTEVAVAVRYKASAPRIGPLLGDHRLRKGAGAFIIRSCCSAKPVSSL